jgi:Uma2 family endonuclease
MRRIKARGKSWRRNPLVIIEVLSETTAAYDRGKKFQFYQEIGSFKEYVVIERDEPVVERYVRQPDGTGSTRKSPAWIRASPSLRSGARWRSKTSMPKRACEDDW